jgi:excisionase family DNA binding protein
MVEVIYAISTAAKIIGVHRSTLYRWIQRGLIKAEKDPIGQMFVSLREVRKIARRK